MKETITDIFRFLIGAIFNFWTVVLLFAAFLIWISIGSSEQERKNKEARRVATELCYTQGMVLVETDAGPRCAAPQALLKLK